MLPAVFRACFILPSFELQSVFTTMDLSPQPALTNIGSLQQVMLPQGGPSLQTVFFRRGYFTSNCTFWLGNSASDSIPERETFLQVVCPFSNTFLQVVLLGRATLLRPVFAESYPSLRLYVLAGTLRLSLCVLIEGLCLNLSNLVGILCFQERCLARPLLFQL